MEPAIIGKNRRVGWIEVICGSMFSGKTEELIRRLRRARFARQNVEIYKPATDARFSAEQVVSHDENAIPSEVVDTAGQLLLMVGKADVVGIDEAQFFDNDLVDVCRTLAQDGRRVIVAGLDQDFLGRPFEPVPQLMAIAEYVTKLHAICVICGAPANHSQRIVADRSTVFLGAKEAYEPRCRECFDPGLAMPKPAGEAGEDRMGKPGPSSVLSSPSTPGAAPDHTDVPDEPNGRTLADPTTSEGSADPAGS